MANDTTITVVGNLTADPELQFTPNGAAVVNFTIASTPKRYNKQTSSMEDGETLFMRASVWREQAENAAESLTKGARVIAHGNLKSRSFQDKEGNNRTSWEVEVQEIAPSLRFATAQVKRNEPKNTAPQQQPAQQQGGWGQPDTWGGAPVQGGWDTPAQQSQVPF